VVADVAMAAVVDAAAIWAAVEVAAVV